MARNLSLAMGLIQAPVHESKLTRTPSWSKNAIARAFETISLIAAAGRVGAAVEARQQPRAQDLKDAGLYDAELFQRPYRN